MFQPIGGLPPRTYWLRRAMLGGALVMSAVLIKNQFADGSSDAATRPQPTSADHQQPAHPAQFRLITPGTTAPAEPPHQRQTEAPRSRPATVSTCPEDVLTLQVAAGARYYGPGEIPVVRYAVTNRSAAACRRDVGEAVQEALVFKGTTRLWSSNDCWPGSQHRVVTLQPDRPERFVMRWSRKSSLPHCHGVRRIVPAGRYTLIGRVGNLMTRAPIRLR